MTKGSDPWDELRALGRERALLESLSAVLAWDEETTMPPGGAAHRSQQQALLAGLLHQSDASPRLAELLDALEGQARGEIEVATVRFARARWQRARRVPRSLTEELARVTTMAQEAWRDARARNDFAIFEPWLDSVVRLKRDEAASLDPRRGAWDVLLDEHEPGLTERALTAVLAPLETALQRLLSTVLGRPRPDARALLERPVSEAAQAELALEVAKAVGFDESRGRLDIAAAHPSTIAIGPGDVRMTTRLGAGDNTATLFCTLHEMGHWLYDTQLLADSWGGPAGETLSSGLHESQARLFEAVVGRGRAFWTWCLPRLRRAYGGFDDVSLDEMLAALGRVERAPLRIGADEVSYNLHVVIRCRLESALLSGDLPVGQLPGAWRGEYERTLGLVPADDNQGCLQDGHWAAGMFGYFPTYALGNLAAAQFYEAANAAEPDLEQALARGDFGPLRDWLRREVHVHGSTRGLFERVKIATGDDLSIAPLVRSLEARYLAAPPPREG
jgi:carboxypeptidase Taq